MNLQLDMEHFMKSVLFLTEVDCMEVEDEGLVGVESGVVAELAEGTATPLLLLIAEQPRSMLQALRGKTKMKFWLILL